MDGVVYFKYIDLLFVLYCLFYIDILFLKVLNVILENEEIYIYYMFKVFKDVFIKDIKWIKNNLEF